MAIGDSSSSQGHDEWAHYYHRNTPSAGSGGLVFARDPPVTESTVVTTTATSAASSAAGGAGGADRAQPVSEGRVGKARRRSRASRKAPTTVLNTDTTNFRAMVQQFTGAPTAPFQGGYPQVGDVGPGGGPATLSFGLHGGAGQLYQRPSGFPFGVQQQQQFQQHHESPLFTLGGAGTSTVYLRPGHGAGIPETAGTDASVPSGQMTSRPAGSTGSSTTNRFLL